MKPSIFAAFVDEMSKLALNGANPMLSMPSSLGTQFSNPLANPLGMAVPSRRFSPMPNVQGAPMTGLGGTAGILAALGGGGLW